MRAVGSTRWQVASSEVVRDINRRVILNLIRTRQPLSRADLARLSGLQRSTISLIVEELIRDHWVLEGPRGRLPRGRRPTYLRLNDDRVIIGVDLRPTQTTVALADVNGKFSVQEVIVTPSDPRQAVDELISRIQHLLHSCREKKVEGIGISLPGRVDPASGRLVFAPNLKWPEFDVRTPVSEATGLEVELENAATACVLAAAWFDHLGSRNLVVVTVSEGIGAGILANGQIARGASGMAGEFGHVPLDPAGPLCGCGSRGCWEVFASNRAALRYYYDSPPPAGGMGFLDLLSLADQGDARAAQAVKTMAWQLGRGMRMIVAGLDPEQILVIGDLTRCWHQFGPVIEAEVAAQVLPGAARPAVVPVHEGGLARLRGTVALVLQKHFGLSNEVPA
ncbi:MAG: ROK family transcriptional regulator [Bryobacteraceae bacterium]